MSEQEITIIGGGLAGCEAAWQISQRGIPVRLHEMKPDQYSPAHSMPALAELVCSNSLRSDDQNSA
ncbi:FAD-dependent oxidoreductase, partial [Thermodesulfobacteriota bacterium]